MQTLFSTDAVHPRDRFDFWHETACREIVIHDSQPQSRQAFRALLATECLGAVRLVRIETSAMRAWRTPRHAAGIDADELLVCRQLSGSLLLEQDGREASLEPGDIVIIDPALPYGVDLAEDSAMLVLKMPRRAFEARNGRARALVGRSLSASWPEVGLASSFLALLPAYAGRVGGASAAMLSEVIPDVLAAAIAADGSSRRLSTARASVLAALRAAVDTRLSNPGLTGSRVAAAAGVSLRYANAVLAAEGTSLARLIQRRRLERCRRALEDPQDRRSLGEIAFGWGFVDLSHFGRRFKAAYGVTPSSYRKQVRRAQAGAAPGRRKPGTSTTSAS